MRRILIPLSIAGILLALVLSLVGYFFHISAARYNTSLAAQELKSLQTLESWLGTGANPDSVDLAIGLSEDALSRALQSLRGVKGKTTSIEGVVLEVSDARVELHPGNIQLFLSLNAHREGSSAHITVNAQGVLLIDRVEVTENGSIASRAHYRIGIREVSTELNLGLVSFRTLGIVNEVVASHAAKEFSESLRFSMPLHIPARVNFDFPKTEEIETDHGKFTIKYEMSEPAILIDAALHIIPSIPTSDAVWFFVMAKTHRDSRLADDKAIQDKEISVTEEKVEQARGRVAALVNQFPTFDSDVVVFANPELFHTVVDTFNHLSDKQRQIDIKLLSRKGHLAKEYKKADIVGTGGYSIEFMDNGSMAGSAQLSRLNPIWSEDNGLTLSGDIRVGANAALRLHIDPYAGGGFHTKVSVRASTTIPLRVRVEARQVALESGASAAVIGPVIECVQFPVRFEDEGALKLGFISYEYLGKEQSRPQVLMSSDTHWSQIAKEGVEGSLQFDEDYWIGIRIVPEAIVTGVHGYRFFGRLESSIAEGPKPQSPKATDQVRSVQRSWNKAVQTSCPEKRPLKYLFAGMKFGPNNTIVRALSAAVAGVDLATETVTLPLKVLKTLVTNPKNSLKELGTGLKKVGKKVEKVGKKVWKALGF